MNHRTILIHVWAGKFSAKDIRKAFQGLDLFIVFQLEPRVMKALVLSKDSRSNLEIAQLVAAKLPTSTVHVYSLSPADIALEI
jgi:hypothetical protein